MHVAVKDRLTGGRADVDADVEPGNRRVTRTDATPRFPEQIVNRRYLGRLELEIIGNMAPWGGPACATASLAKYREWQRRGGCSRLIARWPLCKTRKLWRQPACLR
jgi:hypothetical protein